MAEKDAAGEDTSPAPTQVADTPPKSEGEPKLAPKQPAVPSSPPADALTRDDFVRARNCLFFAGFIVLAGVAVIGEPPWVSLLSTCDSCDELWLEHFRQISSSNR